MQTEAENKTKRHHGNVARLDSAVNAGIRSALNYIRQTPSVTAMTGHNIRQM